MFLEYEQAMKMELIARCDNGTATLAELETLYDNDREITFSTFARNVNVESISLQLGYATGRQPGLKLKDDYAVRFYRSVFRGKICYHMDWSAIDHIFQEI